MFINKNLGLSNSKTKTARNGNSQYLPFVWKRSYICYYIICMIVPLKISQYAQEGTCVGVPFNKVAGLKALNIAKFLRTASGFGPHEVIYLYDANNFHVLLCFFATKRCLC